MKYMLENHKRVLVMFIVFFLSGVLLSCANAMFAKTEPPISSIRVVTDNHYPPYIFLDEQGTPRGILVDQWALWEEKTGVNVQLSAVPWEDALTGMEDGKYDVIDTIFYTEERAKQYDFSAAYARIDVPIFFHNNISGIAGVDDLMGFRVAVKTGDADAEFLEKAGVKDLVYYASYEEIILAAAKEEETVFVIDQPPGLYYLYKQGLQDQFNQSEPLFSGEFHRAVKKGNVPLLAQVEGGFASISKAEYKTIEERWVGVQHNNKWQETLPYLMAGSLGAFLVILILVIFNRTLQRRVSQRASELNQALASLQKSERKYREIFNATTEAIFIHAATDGRLLHVNQSMLQMYGYESEEEVLSVNMEALSSDEPPYSLSDARRTMQSAIEEGPQVFEWLAKKKNGEKFWVEISLRYSQIGGERQMLAVARNIARRKQAEKALRTSESMLREAQEIANLGSYVLDFNSGMWESSAVLDKIFGIDEAYIRSVEGWSNLIHPDHRQQMTEYFLNEVAGKRIPFDREYKIIRQSDQAERWLHGLGALEVDEQGVLLNMRGVIQDITERKQAEEVLRESEDKFKYVFDNSVVAKSFTEPDGRQHVNQAFCKMLGYSGQELNGRHWREITHPEDIELDLKEVKDILDGKKESARFIKRYIHKNGQAVWVDISTSLRRDADGNPRYFMTTVLDITERKQAEQLLREREREYRTLVEQIPAIVYVDDVSSGIHTIYISPQIEKILGYTPQYWIENSPGIWDDCIHPNDYETVHAKYLRCAKSGEPSEAEYRMIAADGRIVWLHDQAVMLRDENGKPQLVHGVMQDITAHKQAESEIRRHVAELETLYESGLAISQLLDPKEIAQKVIELLERKLDWHHTTIRLYHPQDESFDLLAFNQPGLKNEAERREVAERFKKLVVHSSQGLSGWSVRNKQVVRSNDLPNDPRYVNTFQGLRSGLYVPMMIGERVVGVISIESENPNGFSLADERLAATLANQAASALENARLFESERKQRQVSEILLDALSAGASMSASLDFEAILDRLLEALERVVPFEGGCIMLVHPEKQTISVAKMRGYNKLEKRLVDNISKFNFDIASMKNLRWILDNKRPLLIPDVEQYPDWLRVPEASFIRSWTGAPIIVNGEVIALFSLDSSVPNFFTDEHVELMRAFTGQASLALQNASLFEETERRFKEFAALYEISNALSADNDLNTLLKDIVEHATTLLSAVTGAMYLYNQRNDSLEIVVTTTPAIPIGATLRLGDGVAGRVAQTHQPMRVEDYSTWENRSHVYDGIIFHAILEVPILFGGDLIGVLSVAEMDDSKRIFTESDEHLLSLFAAQAAGVLHSARLREETARRAREFAALYETSNALSSENDLKAMLQVIVEHARKLLDASSSGMYLYLTESEELELTVDTTPYIPLGARLKLNEGVAGRVAQTHQPLRIDDYSVWDGRSLLYDGIAMRAVLEVPMLYGGELIGVLTADEIDDSERKFTEADEHLLSLLASQAAGAIHSARLRQQTRHRLDQLQALHLIDRAISSSFDLHPILNTVIGQTIAQLNVDAVDILLYHPHLQTLEYVVGQGFRTHAIEQTRLRLGEDFSGRAAFERRTVHIPSLSDVRGSFTRADILKAEGFLECYAVPLIAKGEVKGVMEVFHRTAMPADPEWLDFLETLAGQAAITIDQTQLFDNLQRANLELVIAYDATIEGWARAMDLRDKETESHTERVTELTISLARSFGVRESEILHIRRGALLHDIGKMGVPDNILLKEGQLTEEEWTNMRRHPQFAYEMLQPIQYLRQSLDIPYCHHEKWDGTGYPRGLKGAQIPLAARIFAIADVWDAITSDRPYRKGWSAEEALEYIKVQSGKQFDPKVVDAFLKMIES